MPAAPAPGAPRTIRRRAYLTCSALEDLAAKLKMDPLEFFLKNLDYTARPDVYRAQLAQGRGADRVEEELARCAAIPAADPSSADLGIGINTWGGAGHASNCRATIHADGSVEVELGTQDLGTATRTMIAMVAAETFGLPLSAIKVKIGDNSYPNSGASGGSTTIGGVIDFHPQIHRERARQVVRSRGPGA